MKFKNKFLIIILSLILILFTFSINSFGADNTETSSTEYHIESTNETVVLPSWLTKYHYFLSCYTDGAFSYVKLVYSTEPITVKLWSDGNYRFFYTNGSSYTCNIGKKVSSFSSEISEIKESSSPQTSSFYIPPSQMSTTNYIANYDVMDYDDNSKVVFQGAPQAKILTQVVEQVEMKAVTQEILGVLPIVLIILVGLIAFWKALSIVRRILSGQ